MLTTCIPSDWNLVKFYEVKVYEVNVYVGLKDNAMNKASCVRNVVEIAKVPEEKSKDETP